MLRSDRRSDRLFVTLPCRAYLGNAGVDVLVTSISDWGLGFDVLLSDVACASRSAQLELCAPGLGEPVWLCGTLVARVSRAEFFADYALRFDAMTEVDRGRLRRWLAVRRLKSATATSMLARRAA